MTETEFVWWLRGLINGRESLTLEQLAEIKTHLEKITLNCNGAPAIINPPITYPYPTAYPWTCGGSPEEFKVKTWTYSGQERERGCSGGIIASGTPFSHLAAVQAFGGKVDADIASAPKTFTPYPELTSVSC